MLINVFNNLKMRLHFQHAAIQIISPRKSSKYISKSRIRTYHRYPEIPTNQTKGSRRIFTQSKFFSTMKKLQLGSFTETNVLFMTCFPFIMYNSGLQNIHNSCFSTSNGRLGLQHLIAAF